MKGDAAGQGVVPLRTILRNILNLIDSFEARYREGLDSYDQEFLELKQFSENLKTDPGYVCKEGEKGVNRKKNRYKDILPFDYTRVILGDYGDIPGSDYINANFIKGASGSSAYIACQGPLPHTVNDFWRMVVECEVQVIVMACNEQESGKHKCENYWVEEDGVEREFGQVTVWLKKCRQVCPDFLVRTMKIRYQNSKGEPEERSVCQFHYSAWPDHGVPLKVRPLLDMVRLIRDCQTSETLPVLVHCSAGCGRTGTICAIDYVWGLLRLGKLTPDFSLFNLVRDMRRQRIAMVQTKDQYILVHRAVKELFEEQLKIIDSHPYANVDINGLPLEIRAELEEPLYETVLFGSAAKADQEETIVISARKKSPLEKPPPPPIPSGSDLAAASSSSVAVTKHEKEAENHQRHLEQEKLKGSTSSVGKVGCTPSPSSDPQCDGASGGENKDISHQEKYNSLEGSSKQSSGKRENLTPGTSKKEFSPKASLLRNPSIVKLKAFFEKSKEDKEKKVIPTLSRAKSDVSSSSRFYTNFTSSFTSRVNRGSSSRTKNVPGGSTSKPNSPKEEFHQKTASPVQKIKSKPALLQKPNISVKRSKSLKITRPSDSSNVNNVNLISASSIGSDFPDSSKLSRSSVSPSASQSSASSQSPLEEHKIKVSVKQVEMPKLQKTVSKSLKAESFKATTSQDSRRNSIEVKKDYQPSSSFGKKDSWQVPSSSSSSKKPQVPSKPHVFDKASIVAAKGIYGTTRVKIDNFADRMQDAVEKGGGSHSKSTNGKIKKYGTVNPKILNFPSGGTLLTRSQSHVWTPSKTQVPVRIFSDENLSQVGSGGECIDKSSRPSADDANHGFINKGCDEPDGSVKLIRKQSLPITKVFSSKIKPLLVTSVGNSELKPKEQPRSLTLTSHSSFLEARKRLPKTNPYANYNPSDSNLPHKDSKPQLSRVNSDKFGISSQLTQYHFGENVPLLKNNSSYNMGNSSESSSNPGTPRTSLPGTPTQSIDVLYSPLSLNNGPGNHSSARGGQHSKSILKGSLSSTPSESDERLDSYRTHLPPVSTNITGPQKICSVRIAVGMRERRNSFRQAVWKEDQAPTATSIPVENGTPENIYITTTSSVPYYVKSSTMPVHQQPSAPTSSNSGSSYMNSTPPAAGQQGGRQYKDYEPIWPDPASSTNPFKIGSSTSTVLVNADSSSVGNGRKPQQGHNSISRFPESSNTGQAHQNKLESQVQDRMAEIKVLLEELRAPGKSEDARQRSSNPEHHLHHASSQIPLRKSKDTLTQSFSGEKSGSLHTSGSSTTNLKHHRSLRAPSRPQYQQGLSCFTFRKPSSFESITDQLAVEDLRMPSSSSTSRDDVTRCGPGSTSDASRRKVDGHYFENSFQPRGDRGLSNTNARLNDYVSLRTCRSSNNNGIRSNMGTSKSGYDGGSIGIQSQSGKDPTTPVPPPRSKRLGTLRRDHGDYANVSPMPFHPATQGWTGNEMNGVSDNHHQKYNSNDVQSSSSGAIRKDSSSTEIFDNHNHQPNGHEFARIASTESIPLSNGNAHPTSPKAIIRALGLFQAKAANVRSRLANWAENKERPTSKRNGVSLTRKNDHVERGGLNEGPSSRPAPSSVSIAGPSTSKHQYL